MSAPHRVGLPRLPILKTPLGRASLGTNWSQRHKSPRHGFGFEVGLRRPQPSTLFGHSAQIHGLHLTTEFGDDMTKTKNLTNAAARRAAACRRQKKNTYPIKLTGCSSVETRSSKGRWASWRLFGTIHCWNAEAYRAAACRRQIMTSLCRHRVRCAAHLDTNLSRRPRN